ncbi:hypothetical protein DID88_010285 [Monilinia fructigena]|uniref:Proline dehydrogenase n=1 Tax=Monilinia fructigena TaxID=38457 RepID=A0A395IM47_9HELO|nr:hypothetical protein DID88_010285 [Monilinia fructigena]
MIYEVTVTNVEQPGLISDGNRAHYQIILQRLPSPEKYLSQYRRRCSSITTNISHQNGFSHNQNTPNMSKISELPPLSIMPMPLLLKSYFVTWILASPRIIKLFLPLLNKLANSNSALLNPDRNPVLHMIVRKFIYDHFIAGESACQVRARVAAMKNLGFRGIILGYAREVNITGGVAQHGSEISVTKEAGESAIKEWRDDLMNTISLLQPGDFLSVKFSGAGPLALHALKNNLPPPYLVQESMHLLLRTARAQKAPYLKATPSNILNHLRLAQAEDWTLGIKLVRGAYIATEKRELIHDTIQDTHKAYNSIAADLLGNSYPGININGDAKGYPRAELFLATHNEESIKRAYAIQSQRIREGKPTIELASGQLQGMADEISCGLLQLCRKDEPRDSRNAPNRNPTQFEEEQFILAQALKPKAYKCMVWGSTQKSLQFLLRRVKENGDALGRTGFWVKGFEKEIWRRIRGKLGV